MTFAEIKARWPWKPIPHCPGRFVFAAGPTAMAPSEIAMQAAEPIEHVSSVARDPVVVTAFADGGLISYRKSNATYLHTLNSREGFERKLRQLGVALPSDFLPD
jgi:hypothetical protein